MLIPHLVFLDDFEQVKSIGRCLEKDWKELLADCFPKIMVNILPYFALRGQDALVAQQREKAHRVYDLLKDSSYLGKQVWAQPPAAATHTFTLILIPALYFRLSNFTLKRPNENRCFSNIVQSKRGVDPAPDQDALDWSKVSGAVGSSGAAEEAWGENTIAPDTETFALDSRTKKHQ